MSSTRKTRAARGTDYYPTPGWCVRALLPHLPPVDHPLDPCAGTGHILHELGGGVGFEIDSSIAQRLKLSTGVDVRLQVRDSLAPGPWFQTAARPTDSAPWPRLVVMNPPFMHAEAFVRRALEEVVPGGTVAALLRLGFLEGMARAALHREHPADVLVLPKRPSFDGKGTDSTAYAWFVWGPGRGGRWKVLDVEASRASALQGTEVTEVAS